MGTSENFITKLYIIVKKLHVSKIGYENISPVLVTLLTIANDARVLARNFSPAKLGAFAFGLLQYAPMIALAKRAWEEFKDLNPNEADIVKAEVKRDFDIPDHKFEQAIEEALDIVVETYEWVVDGGDIWDKMKAYYGKHIEKDPLPDREPA